MEKIVKAIIEIDTKQNKTKQFRPQLISEKKVWWGIKKSVLVLSHVTWENSDKKDYRFYRGQGFKGEALDSFEAALEAAKIGYDRRMKEVGEYIVSTETTDISYIL